MRHTLGAVKLTDYINFYTLINCRLQCCIDRNKAFYAIMHLNITSNLKPFYFPSKFISIFSNLNLLLEMFIKRVEQEIGLMKSVRKTCIDIDGKQDSFLTLQNTS